MANSLFGEMVLICSGSFWPQAAQPDIILTVFKILHSGKHWNKIIVIDDEQDYGDRNVWNDYSVKVLPFHAN